MIISAALPSVSTRWNPNPSEPRLQIVENQNIITALQNFKDISNPFYDFLSGRSITLEKLKAFSKRKTKLNGDHLTVSGSKADYSNAILEFDLDFISYLHKPLYVEEEIRVKRIIFSPMLSESPLEDDILSTIGTSLHVTQRMFRQLEPDKSIDIDLMSAILQLFIERDHKLRTSYRDMNYNKRSYEPFRKSLFHAILIDDCNQYYFDFGVDQLTETEYYRSYVVFKVDMCWKLVVVDYLNQKLLYVNPLRELQDQHKQYIKTVINNNYLALVIGEGHHCWDIEEYEHQYYDFLTAERILDSGIYMFIILYFIVQDIPIEFSKDIISPLVRLKLGCLLLVSELEF
jgi:hypothetical protein